VVEPPTIAAVEVFVADNKFVVLVDKIPLVNVNTPVTVVAPPNV